MKGQKKIQLHGGYWMNWEVVNKLKRASAQQNNFSPGQSNQSQAQPDCEGGGVSDGREGVALVVVEEEGRVEGGEVDHGHRRV